MPTALDSFPFSSWLVSPELHRCGPGATSGYYGTSAAMSYADCFLHRLPSSSISVQHYCAQQTIRSASARKHVYCLRIAPLLLPSFPPWLRPSCRTTIHPRRPLGRSGSQLLAYPVGFSRLASLKWFIILAVAGVAYC